MAEISGGSKADEREFVPVIAMPGRTIRLRRLGLGVGNGVNSLAKTVGLLLLVFFSAAFGLAAQQTGGSISGTIKDQTGAIIPRVAITAKNVATQVTNTVRTNGSGAYSFLSLPIGTYELQVRLSGFKDYRKTNIALNVNDALREDIVLEVGMASETVEVSANAAHVNTNSATLGQVIGGRSVVDQPLVDRSYIDLMGLQAGVNPSTDSPTGNVSVSGGRADANSFSVNGGNVEESGHNGAAIIPDADAIAQFEIVTNSATAEYGHYNGGAISVITKSGSNNFHGDVFEFWRNQSLDATTPFANEKGPYNHNQFGGTLGGPIKKNKLFFFTDYQGTRNTTGIVDIAAVPTNGAFPGAPGVPISNELAGNLSDRAGPASPYDDFYGSVSSANFAGILQSRLGYAVSKTEPYYYDATQIDPQTVTAANPSGSHYPGPCTTSAYAITPGVSQSGCVFPNAIIPASAWSAPAAQLLKYAPQPTPGAIIGGLPVFENSSAAGTLSDDKGSARVDATNGLGQLSFYYFLDDSAFFNPYGRSDLPGFAARSPARAQQLNIGDTKTLGAKAVNDFKLNYTRSHFDAGIPIGGIGPALSSLGFQEGANTLGLVPVDPAREGVPIFNTNELSGGASNESAETDNTFQFTEAYSLLRGNHQFKFGGEGDFAQVIQHNVVAPNGQFDFAGAETGDDLADFLIGAVGTFTQSSNQSLDSASWYYGVFAQDTWRIKPSLILNYGIRQDVSTFFYDTQNKTQTIVPGLQSQVFPGAPTGWVFPGDPGIPRTIVPTRYNNFAPRFAFAYSPNYIKGLLGKMFGPSGHTAIRGAWGIFYGIVDDSTVLDQVADAPFILYWQQNNTLFSTPWELMNGTVQGQHFPFTPPPVGDKNIDWSYFEPITSSPGIAINDRLPYSEEYNFTIERQVGANTVVDVAYVGSQSHRLPGSVEANPGIPSICAFLSNPANLGPGSDTCGPGNENDVFQLSAANGGGTIYGTRQPLGINFGTGDQYLVTVGRSTYNSLQASVNHTGKTYTLMAAYTWSKSMDTGSENNSAFDPLPSPLPALPAPLPSALYQQQPSIVLFGGAPDYNYFRALSSFDVPQNLVLSYSYNLSFNKILHHSSRFTSGWTITGTTRFASGTPIALRYGIDNSYIGTFNLDVPDFNGGNVSHLNPRNLATNPDRFWLRCPKASSTCSTGLFSAEPLGQIGNAMRFSVIGPGINNTDVSLAKNLPITKERRLQFRIDAFNVFNHTQFANPSGNFTSANFMELTRARPARIAQLAVKFIF